MNLDKIKGDAHMHQTLDAPVYEINQESDFYKRSKWRKDQKGRINEILLNIADT